MDIKKHIRTIPHFPKQGVMFRDITTLLKSPEALRYVIGKFVERYKDKEIDKIVGIESRGFIFGSILAHELNIPFILARKPGKLPAETEKIEYETEYSKDGIEIHKDGINPGEKVLIVDDLLATSGTSRAAAELVEKMGGKVEEIGFLVELPELKGREKLSKYNLFSLVEFEGE